MTRVVMRIGDRARVLLDQGAAAIERAWRDDDMLDECIDVLDPRAIALGYLTRADTVARVVLEMRLGALPTTTVEPCPDAHRHEVDCRSGGYGCYYDCYPSWLGWAHESTTRPDADPVTYGPLRYDARLLRRALAEVTPSDRVALRAYDSGVLTLRPTLEAPDVWTIWVMQLAPERELVTGAMREVAL